MATAFGALDTRLEGEGGGGRRVYEAASCRDCCWCQAAGAAAAACLVAGCYICSSWEVPAGPPVAPQLGAAGCLLGSGCSAGKPLHQAPLQLQGAAAPELLANQQSRKQQSHAWLV